MSATYDPNLSRDLDWVRFQVGDRDIDDPQLQDQEIEAMLAEEPNKYLAAARAGEAIVSRGGGDIVSKSVGDLSVTYGDTGSVSFESHLQSLRRKGLQILDRAHSGGSVLRTL